jgi:hypothetical protein
MATFQTAVAKVLATLCFRPETARTMSGRAVVVLILMSGSRVVFATAKAPLALLPNPPFYVPFFKKLWFIFYFINR